MPKKDTLSVNIINELILFVCVFIWINDVKYYSNTPLNENERLDKDHTYSTNQNLIAN
jgi:hypothetical protein